MNKSILKFTVLGFLYGTILDFFGFGFASAGHGTYIPLAFASAPFNFFGILIGIVSAPLFWGFLGYLSAVSDYLPNRIVIYFLMLSHYAGLFIQLTLIRPWNNWKTFSKIYDMDQYFLLVNLAIYLTGQILFWFYFIQRKKMN